MSVRADCNATHFVNEPFVPDSCTWSTYADLAYVTSAFVCGTFMLLFTRREKCSARNFEAISIVLLVVGLATTGFPPATMAIRNAAFSMRTFKEMRVWTRHAEEAVYECEVIIGILPAVISSIGFFWSGTDRTANVVGASAFVVTVLHCALATVVVRNNPRRLPLAVAEVGLSAAFCAAFILKIPILCYASLSSMDVIRAAVLWNAWRLPAAADEEDAQAPSVHETTMVSSSHRTHDETSRVSTADVIETEVSV